MLDVCDGGPPVVGHTVVVNGELSVRENMYADLDGSQMAEAVVKAPKISLKWLVGSRLSSTYPTSRGERRMSRRPASSSSVPTCSTPLA